MSSSNEEFDLNRKIPEDIQENIAKLSQNHKSGLWASQFQEEYKKLTTNNLLYGNRGYGSLLHLLSNIPHLVKIAKHAKGDFKIYPADSKHIPSKLTEENLNAEEILLPSFAVQLTDIIPKYTLPITNKAMTIQITHVYDPSKFWFITEENIQQLFSLNKKMQSFYSPTGYYYQIPSYKIVNSLYCVSWYHKCFNRCVIVDVLAEEITDIIKVFFIDYGTVDIVNIKDIYYLHEHFKEPNALANRGRLTSIQPVGLNMPWSKKAIKTFEDLVLNKVIETKVITTRLIDHLEYNLVLYDKTPRVGYIHKILQENDLALDTSEEQVAALSISEFVGSSHRMHLVPTFKDIECGIAPTKSELQALEKINYPVQDILKKYLS